MIITRTPLRISFAGGGSDLPVYYNNDEMGAVISAAINLYVYTIIKPHWEKDQFRISYSVTENVSEVDDIDHDLIREAIKLIDVPNCEIVTVADVPGKGTGLGSSAAVTVGVLNALYALKGFKNTDAKLLAEKACQIEIETLKKYSGKQDQFASAFGGIYRHEFYRHDVVSYPIALSKKMSKTLSDSCNLFYTGNGRSADSVLDVLTDNLNRSWQKKAVIKNMVALVAQAEDAIYNGNMMDLGAIVSEGWKLKKKTCEAVTNDHINTLYAAGMECGAYGGKLLGAGNGGFLLFICPQELTHEIEKHTGMRCLRPSIGVPGSEVVYDDR